MTHLSIDAASHRKGQLITAFGGLMLTADIPLIRLSEGDAWSVLAVRSGLTFVTAVIVWLAIRLITGRSIPILPGRAAIAVVTFYILASISFMLAVFATTTANLVFILAFTPMFAALLSWVTLGERPSTATFIAMAVMIAGVALIVADGLAAGHFLGDLTALASAFCLSCAITVSRRSRADMGFAPLFSALVPAIIGLTMAGGPSHIVVEAPWWIVLNGLVVTPLAFWCLATGPKYISGPEVAMFYLLETIFAPVWVWMIFAEEPSRNGLIGGLVMIVTLIVHSLWQLVHNRRMLRTLAPRHPV
ncbi:EamA-like transporter family protein [Hoeflea marina]|uniref:EamA-like transporter family protein n=1 Tax=Hoeflea marina TaxID=274592 RepID=A0A317PRP0_9HYPH|nr:DMT family transporter [Hoeflea marina]PWW03405.1 EamA-like transporter family protein [Hoeflea marina]